MKSFGPPDMNSSASAWPGLTVHPRREQQPAEPVSMHQQLLNEGVQARPFRCEACSKPILNQSVFCPHCDEGPLHPECSVGHICPAQHQVLPPPILPSGGGASLSAFPGFEEGQGGEKPGDPLDSDSSWEHVSPRFPNIEQATSAFMGAPSFRAVPPPTGFMPVPGQRGGLLFGGIPSGATIQNLTGIRPPTLSLAAEAVRQESPARKANLPPDDVEGPTKKKRSTEPVVKPYSRGSADKTERVETDDAELAKAMKTFEEEKFASSNIASYKSKVKWWVDRAKVRGVDPFPLTLEMINVAGALLKAGGYRSSAQYFAAMKREHVTRGHPWQDILQQGVADAVRSCMRGLGPDRSCPSLDLRRLENLGPEAVRDMDGVPKNPVDIVVLFSLFACREMEAALRVVGQITIVPKEGTCGVVSLYLPASKTDPKGDGVLRKQGCTCLKAPGLCPVAAAQRLLDIAHEAGRKPDEPLLVVTGKPDSDKDPPTKAAMVQAFRLVAEKAGYDSQQVKALTGHALRSTGAQHLARMGVEFYKIQLYCRWGSETILRYLRDAPLEESETWLSGDTNPDFDMGELVEQTVNTVQVINKEVDKKEVEALIYDLFNNYVTKELDQFVLARTEIDLILEELRAKGKEIKDVWAAELTRKFLPRYVMNLQSRRIHAVRDAYACGCGYDFRNSKDYELMNEIPEGAARCETSGCTKLFDRLM